MKIISLFSRSGHMLEPWALAGHDVLSIDSHEATHNMPHMQGDILKIPPMECDILFAFPPCQHLSAAGAAHWKKKGSEPLAEALVLWSVAHLWTHRADLWMVENPRGRVVHYWPKWNWKFQPFEFAEYNPENPGNDAYTKMTYIWSNFSKPNAWPKMPTGGMKKHRCSKYSKDRAYRRAITPKGFAWAVYQHLIKNM